MKTIDIDRATESLSSYAHRLHKEMLVVTDHSKPVVAVVSLEGVDEESLSLSGNPEFLEIIRRSRAECARGETLSIDEMKKACAEG